MELMLITNLYIVMVVLWTASFIYRAAQNQMKRASFLMGLILILWIILHLMEIKTESPVVSRYIWYSYTIFELALPLVLLWLAYAVDKPDGKIGIPKWMWALIVVCGVIAAITLTNDFHLLAHPLDVNDPDWKMNYGYGIGFYIWQAGWMLPFLAAVGIMLTKIGINVRKRMLIFPIAFIMFLLAFQYGYNTRIPVVFESDRVMINGIFVLLFVESFVRSGLLPVNTKYRALFTHSPLNIRILDSAKKTALSSGNAVWYDYETFDGAHRSYPVPARQDENTLVFAAPIKGGYALWQEDITVLTRLYKETEESVNRLKAANIMLAEEEQIKKAAQDEMEKTRLMEQLEGEIAGFTIRLHTMIEQLESNVDKEKATARIILLLCYIKRRCNLFFREKEGDTLPANELLIYLEELAEMAALADVRAIVTRNVHEHLPVRCATLFYDLLQNVIYWATWTPGVQMLVHLGEQDGQVLLRLLPSEDARSFQLNRGLKTAISDANGEYTVTDLDGAVGMCLSFPGRAEE